MIEEPALDRSLPVEPEGIRFLAGPPEAPADESEIRFLGEPTDSSTDEMNPANIPTAAGVGSLKSHRRAEGFDREG